MNDWLAQLYGTAPTQDVEPEINMNKTASVALLEKVAEEIGADFSDIDLDALSEEDAEELLNDIFAEAPEEGEVEAEAPEQEATDEEPEADTADEGDLDKEAMAKLAEADFYGRAMAHAYVDELRLIEKQAMSKEDAKERLKAALMGGGKPMPKKGKKSEKYEDKDDDDDDKDEAEEKTASALDSAIDSMAVDMANQMIEEYGLQKRAVSKDVEEAVQHRALELLIENGYVDPSDLG